MLMTRAGALALACAGAAAAEAAARLLLLLWGLARLSRVHAVGAPASRAEARFAHCACAGGLRQRLRCGPLQQELAAVGASCGCGLGRRCIWRPLFAM